MLNMFPAFLMICSIGAKHFLLETVGNSYKQKSGIRIIILPKIQTIQNKLFKKNHPTLQRMRRNKRYLMVGSIFLLKQKVSMAAKSVLNNTKWSAEKAKEGDLDRDLEKDEFSGDGVEKDGMDGSGVIEILVPDPSDDSEGSGSIAVITAADKDGEEEEQSFNEGEQWVVLIAGSHTWKEEISRLCSHYSWL